MYSRSALYTSEAPTSPCQIDWYRPLPDSPAVCLISRSTESKSLTLHTGDQVLKFDEPEFIRMFLFGYLFFSFLNFATIPRQNVRDVSFSECPIEDTETSVTPTTVLPTFPTDSMHHMIPQQSDQCCVMASYIISSLSNQFNVV